MARDFAVTKKEKLLDSAQKALQKGSLDKALADYQAAVVEDPKDTRTWLKVAELQTKRGKKEDATKTYLKTADLYTEQGFFQRAVAVYKNVLKLSPGFVEAHFKLADLFRQLGLLSDAMQQYEAAAGVYQREGKVAESLDAMRRIVELNPDHVMSRIKLAEASAQAGLKEEAITEFGRACQHLKLVGKTDEYLRVAERLLALQPANLTLAHEMAESYVERGNGRFALAKLQPAFNQNPRDVRTLGLLSRAFEQLGQVAKTVSVLKELARIHRDEGRDNEGLAAYQKIAVLDPSDSEARNEVARAQKMAPMMQKSGKGGGEARPAAITFSEMAVPQFLLPRDISSSISLPGSPSASFEGQALSASSSASLPAMPTRMSSGQLPAGGNADVERIISECDVFVKYALLERAADHLRKVFDLEAQHAGARERLAFVLLQLGRNPEAATQFAMLAEQFRKTDSKKSAEFARHAAAAGPVPPGLESAGAIGADLTSPGDLDEEILDVDELGGEFIGEDSTAGGASTDEFAALLRTAGTGRAAPRVTPPPAANQERPMAARPKAARPAMAPPPGPEEPEPVRRDEWNPPTFAEMALPQFPAELDVVEKTRGNSVASVEVLAADLEQVDFFIQSGLADEARSLIEDLEVIHPGSAAVAERRERLASAMGAVPGGVPTAAPQSARNATLLREGEYPAPEWDDALAPAAAQFRRNGDLDAAIAEYRKLLRDPGKEVHALMMIGECFAEKGSLPDAVMHLKKALNRGNVTESETTNLYYALGKVFVSLGDDKEALYFFEKVIRRDTTFKDVGDHISRLRRGAAS